MPHPKKPRNPVPSQGRRHRRKLVGSAVAGVLALTGLVGSGTGPAGAATPPPCLSSGALTSSFGAAADTYSINNARVTVWNAAGTCYTASRGTSNDTAAIPVASASKLVSSEVIARVMYLYPSSLNWNTTVGSIPEFAADSKITADVRNLTLKQLMGFTDGLEAEDTCIYLIVGTTPMNCVKKILENGLVTSTNTIFYYGGTHLQVAGQMALLTYNRLAGTTYDWNGLYTNLLGSKLGAGGTYYADPINSLGVNNPMVAGGLVISMVDYGKLLRFELTGGLTTSGTRLANASFFTDQSKQWFPGAAPSPTSFSPVAPLWPYQQGRIFNYGLGSWRECPMPAPGTDPSTTTCSVMSSPGAFGFTPWVDYAHGIYGIVGMEDLVDMALSASSAKCATGVSATSLQSQCKGIGIEQAVQPTTLTLF